MMPDPAWSLVCKEPGCWWCGPFRATLDEARDDLADHMDDHYREEQRR